MRSDIHGDPEQMAPLRGLIDSCKTANAFLFVAPRKRPGNRYQNKTRYLCGLMTSRCPSIAGTWPPARCMVQDRDPQVVTGRDEVVALLPTLLSIWRRSIHIVEERDGMRSVRCPKCGRQMRLASWRAPENGSPGAEGFKCDPCGVEATKEAN